MSNRIVVAFKNQIVVAFIVCGAIILAIPICIFGLIRLAWVEGKSLALGRPVVPQEKIRHLLETIETHIGPQTDKRTKSDSSARQGTENGAETLAVVSMKYLVSIYGFPIIGIGFSVALFF